ncbi:SSS family transporter [Roseivirga ehrenbergii]|uniref:Sodium:solute symporter n=1 Tax=Roseivirga ehrenbergii (strain DSM 102268 / JCM 13514 / KCTC 12282 / NCIMB 14502 / KMM 6017) TaxID=279360 RepID=A0A150XIY6_ROSEK|nr:sodium:solute symporter [Roseivirga ehrenbergii]KYG78622.1 sodium:solute symporter [Roseivirga ehrenbergii]TCL10403.1 SSS family transporter [Roseivirga ehrenbergii]
MNPTLVISIIGGYFLLLILISRFTSKGADSATFFTANKQSPWYLVAFGMIGASLSGVTFISVPGEVGNSFFSYFQVVLGYIVGYLIIATVLMPLYYRLNLVSIYTYLEQRFGFWSYKTGSFFFMLSRTVGASFRLFLVASVLQIALFDSYGVPFWVSVLVTIALIWVYTFRGGIKTIVWTDTLQTFFMLSAVVITIYIITKEMGIGLGDAITQISDSEYSKTFFFDWNDKKDFFKQFISGVFIAIVMTGLDQDMMQKNLTCRTLKDAQKNIFWFTIALVIANILFLSMGALLYLYAGQNGIEIPTRTDNFYPLIALNHLGTFGGVVFLLGIVAAAYSSADSALTSLTTAFCVDFLNFEKKEESVKKPTRLKVHLGFSVLLFIVIIIFNAINDSSVISAIFKVAGYTYGPLLGLFSFGLMTKLKVRDNLVLPVCLLSPAISYLVDMNSAAWFNGFQFGFFILIFNAGLTFLGMLLISTKK